jgi:hypothetical protein
MISAKYCALMIKTHMERRGETLTARDVGMRLSRAKEDRLARRKLDIVQQK